MLRTRLTGKSATTPHPWHAKQRLRTPSQPTTHYFNQPAVPPCRIPRSKTHEQGTLGQHLKRRASLLMEEAHLQTRAHQRRQHAAHSHCLTQTVLQPRHRLAVLNKKHSNPTAITHHTHATCRRMAILPNTPPTTTISEAAPCTMNGIAAARTSKAGLVRIHGAEIRGACA